LLLRLLLGTRLRMWVSDQHIPVDVSWSQLLQSALSPI
jgi:hypothetical protein